MQKKKTMKAIRNHAIPRFASAFTTVFAGVVGGIELSVHTGLGCPPPLGGWIGIARVFAIAGIAAAFYTGYKTMIDLSDLFDERFGGRSGREH